MIPNSRRAVMQLNFPGYLQSSVLVLISSTTLSHTADQLLKYQSSSGPAPQLSVLQLTSSSIIIPSADSLNIKFATDKFFNIESFS
jgi:hypothetical protein